MDLPPAPYSAEDPWWEYRLKRLRQALQTPWLSSGGLRTGVQVSSFPLEQPSGIPPASVQDKEKPVRHYRGVVVIKPFHSWRAKIKVKSKTWSLGHYGSEIDAALAYDAAAWFLRGPKATLTFRYFSCETICPPQTPPSWVINLVLSEVCLQYAPI